MTSKTHINKNGEAGVCGATKKPCPYQDIETSLPMEYVKDIISKVNADREELIAVGYTGERLVEAQREELSRRLNFVTRQVKRQQEEEARAIEEERLARESNPEWLASVDGEAFLLRKEMEANDGYLEFESLFDNDGNLLNAKKVRTKYGKAWMIFDKDDKNQEFVKEWFSPSKAKTPSTAEAANRKKGFFVGKTKEKAKIRIRSEVDRYSGARHREVVVYRDRDNPGEVRVVDNGQ